MGAAITAEIGTMRVTEQIDALRCMAVSPVGYLVLPRLLSCMAMLPILTVFGVSIGVFGGMIVASLTHGVSSYVFIHSIEVFCYTFRSLYRRDEICRIWDDCSTCRM